MTIAEMKANYILALDAQCNTINAAKAVHRAASKKFKHILEIEQHPEYENLVKIYEVYEDGSKNWPITWPKNQVEEYENL